jgi:hypothetical protein
MAKLTKAQLTLLIDEYGDLKQQADLWQPSVNPHLQRLAEVEAQLLALQAEADPEQPIVLDGARWKVPISTCRKQAKLIASRLPVLFKRLGQAWVLENCAPTLAAVKAALPKDQHKSFIAESRGTVRTVGNPVLKEVS